MAETMMRQTRPQHQRRRNTRCSLMPKIKGGKQGASISCRMAHPTTRRMRATAREMSPGGRATTRGARGLQER